MGSLNTFMNLKFKHISFSDIFFIHHFQNKDDHNRVNPRQHPGGTVDAYQFTGGFAQQQYYQQPPVQYPGQQYYERYNNGAYHQDYRRPYENYHYGYPQPEYSYRSHGYPQPPPPPQPVDPPRSRENHHDYRRESFSTYSQPTKRSRSAHPEPREDNRYPEFEPISPRHRSTTRTPRPTRSSTPVRRRPRAKSASDADLSEDDRNVSQNGANNESVDSITSLLDKSYISAKVKVPQPTVPSILDESMSDSEETDIKISEKEKKDYFTRLELLYHTLDEHLQMPESQQKPGTSLARGKVVVKVKPTSLPSSAFVQEKFDEYYERAQQSIEKVQVKKPKKGSKSDQKESEKVKVLSTQKPKLGFDKTPFRPKWLYVIDNPDWPTKVQPEEDITLLNPNNEMPYDAFVMTRKELYKIQQATANAMNAACYIDWKMAALRKLVAAAQHPEADQEAHLNAIEDLLDGTAYSNEYITDMCIYIHGGVTHKMRKDYLDQMEDLTPNEYIELLSQPYDAAAAFNGQIPNVVKNIKDRQTAMALRKMAQNQQQNNRDGTGKRPRRRFNRNRQRGRNNNNTNGYQPNQFLQRNYGNKSSASKAGNKTNYGSFTNHGRQNNNQNTRSNWNRAVQNYQRNQAFQQRNNSNKSRKHNFRQPQGNRNFNQFYWN